MPKPESPTQISLDEVIQEEAMKLARGIQKPGQTKEQTRLIAQGIAKGIAMYKKQESAKARERDKARKRALKLRQAELQGQQVPVPEESADEAETAGGALAWWMAAAGFLLLAMLHALPLLAGWSIMVGAAVLPAWVSGLVAAACAGGAGFFLYRACLARRQG